MKNAVIAEFGLFRRLDLDEAPREIRLMTANIDVSFETPFELGISKSSDPKHPEAAKKAHLIRQYNCPSPKEYSGTLKKSWISTENYQ